MDFYNFFRSQNNLIEPIYYHEDERFGQNH